MMPSDDIERWPSRVVLIQPGIEHSVALREMAPLVVTLDDTSYRRKPKTKICCSCSLKKDLN